MADPNKLSPDEIETRVSESVAELMADAALSTEPYPDGTVPLSRLARLVINDPEALEAYKAASRRHFETDNR